MRTLRDCNFGDHGAAIALEAPDTLRIEEGMCRKAGPNIQIRKQSDDGLGDGENALGCIDLPISLDKTKEWLQASAVTR